MPVTEQGKEAALEALVKRRANKPKQIRNEDLPAGSSMYFYCVACGWLAGTLPELYLDRPPKLCVECVALKEAGWLL